MITEKLKNEIQDMDPNVALKFLKSKGMNEDEACKEYRSWRRNFMRNFIREEDLKKRSNKPAVLDKQKVIDLYFTQGLSADKTAIALGVSGHTVRKNLKKWGYKNVNGKYVLEEEQ